MWLHARVQTYTQRHANYTWNLKSIQFPTVPAQSSSSTIRKISCLSMISAACLLTMAPAQSPGTTTLMILRAAYRVRVGEGLTAPLSEYTLFASDRVFPRPPRNTLADIRKTRADDDAIPLSDVFGVQSVDGRHDWPPVPFLNSSAIAVAASSCVWRRYSIPRDSLKSSCRSPASRQLPVTGAHPCPLKGFARFI